MTTREAIIQKIINENRKKQLTVVFLGGSVRQYRNHGYFKIFYDRLTTKDMPFARHNSKVLMIKKGDELLYGRCCRECGNAVPKCHGNCHKCKSFNIEEKHV